LFLLAPPRDYTRGGVRLRAAPAARQRINLVVCGGSGMGWIKAPVLEDIEEPFDAAMF